MAPIKEPENSLWSFIQDTGPDDDPLLHTALKNLADTTVYDANSANDFFTSLKISTICSSLSILNLNIRSLSKNISELQMLLCKLNWKFSVICLQETWSKTEANNLTENIELAGYNFISLPRENMRRGGGVGVYVKDDLVCKMRKDLSKTSEEAEVLTIELTNHKAKNIILSNIYRPPSGSTILYYETVVSLLNKVNQEKKPFYIAGDFNLNLLDYETHSNIRDVINVMFEYMLIPSINKPTRITSRTSTCIDNIFVPYSCHNKYYAGVITEKISDHLPQFLITSNIPITKRNEQHNIETRKFTPEKISEMKERLKNTSWNSVTSVHNVNEAYSAFKDEFEYLYNDLFPKKIVTVKTKSILNRWMNKELLKMSRKKQKLYNKYIKSKTYTNESKYKDFKRKFEKKLQHTKKEYYSQLLVRHQADLRKTWSILKDLISNKPNRGSNLPKNLNICGRDILSRKEMASVFNKFFVNVGSDLAQAIPRSTKSFESFLTPAETAFEIGKIDGRDILNAITSLKPHKSPGYDEFSIDVIKQVANELLTPLAYIFNLSCDQCVFPRDLKIAKVIPSYKAEDPTIVSNYRPISLISVFSKILEKVIHIKLYSYLEQKGLLYPRQFGFRKNHNTEYGILDLLSNIRNAMEQRLYTIGVFLDLAKAFDTVDHSILLKKMSLYGVSEKSATWFENYLSGRTQYVDINGTSTTLLPISCGVPQGSILGPLLFLIYINDLSNCVPGLQVILFADDTNIFLSHKNISTLFSTMNAQLKNLENWFHANRLSINLTKTKYMVFGKERDTDNLPLKLPPLLLSSASIKRVYATKFLGITLDENLSWTRHINILEANLSQNVGVLAKVRKNLNSKAAKSLYFAFIHSYLSYGNIIWASTYKGKLSKLYNIQKRAVRIISSADRLAHSRPIMAQHKVLNVFELNIFQTLLFVYKHKQNTLPNVFRPKLSIIKHRYSSRLAKHGYSEKSTIGKNRYGIEIRGPFLWNRLNCVEAKASTDPVKFKTELKKFLLDRPDTVSTW